MAKRRKNKYKVHWSLKDKILAVLAILSFLLTVGGVISKYTGSSEEVAVPSKAKKSINKSW